MVVSQYMFIEALFMNKVESEPVNQQTRASTTLSWAFYDQPEGFIRQHVGLMKSLEAENTFNCAFTIICCGLSQQKKRG